MAIPPNPSNMCVNCIRSQVDITEGLQKQVTLLWCKECERYLQPPKHWVRAALESKELLTLCIKRLKGLQKVLCQAPEQVLPSTPNDLIAVKTTQALRPGQPAS